jgi:hypothetical protein
MLDDRAGMSKAHLALIRLLPCAVCRIYGGVQAHHLMVKEHRGIGMRAPDMFAIPLCDSCHHRLHTRGSRAHTELLRGEGVDDLRLASELWQESLSNATYTGKLNAMRSIVMRHEVGAR